VPALVPKPGSPTVTQEHQPGRESDALRALGYSWAILDSEIFSLKIRVSVGFGARPASALKIRVSVGFGARPASALKIRVSVGFGARPASALKINPH